MRRFALAAALGAAFLLITGCASAQGQAALGIAEKVAGGDVTDKLIKRLEAVNDKLLEDIEKAEAWLKSKVERLAKAKCLMPTPALVRYARSSEERRIAVAVDCHIVVAPLEAVVPPPPPEREPSGRSLRFDPGGR